MSGIATYLEARAVWDRLAKKYSNLAPALTEEKRAHYHQRNSAPIAAQQNTSAMDDGDLKRVRIIQRHWKQLLKKDTLIFVNPNGNHDSNFNHLVNKNKIKRSFNKDKLQLLKNAIDSGDWKAEIFNDETLPQLAMSLYAAEKITPHQIYSILEYHQTKNDYAVEEIYRILDDENQFTKAALSYLLPLFNDRKNVKNPSSEELESFRLLVSALPPSERIFYVTGVGKTYLNPHTMGETLINTDGLYGRQKDDVAHRNQRQELIKQFNAQIEHVEEIIKQSELLGQQSTIEHETLLEKQEYLMYIRDWRANDNQYDEIIHLSSGAQDAIGIALFGENNFVRPMSRLGGQSLEDIEHGVRHDARYTATQYPETKPYRDGLHSFHNITPLEASGHDKQHATVMSTIPTHLRQGLLRLVDVTREYTKLKWSKEIWSWAEIDYLFAFRNNKTLAAPTTIKESTELFCDILIFGGDVRNKNYGTELTPVAALTYLDMIKNKGKWRQIGINPNDLVSGLKTHFTNISILYPFIANDAPNIQMFKCLLYSELLKNDANKETLPKRINQYISHLDAKKIDISKMPRENTIVMTYDGQLISPAIIKDFQVRGVQAQQSGSQSKKQIKSEKYSPTFFEGVKITPKGEKVQENAPSVVKKR